ncbi:SpoIID/LytB domain-containing protein [Desulfolucanica intricata]|uniref:SpoIID/LytB domain-containing protein n=1 Tax=Desulfolucanica intricata TaxID=1285191 RepID=UPI0008306829|nr:SpoIID/LytB domain-containing protein [Desulfolucanica intricata]
MKKMFLVLRMALVVGLAVILCLGCARVQKKPGPNAVREEPTISLYVNETGEKKNLKMEEYIAGVVAAEMEPTWPTNALAAQAILARTFTMRNIETGKIKKLHGTDASTSTDEFQAYDPSRINDRVRKAVEMTRGEVVTYQGRYTNAWFNACCGGITASAREGLAFNEESTPYIKANVKDNCLKITTPENKQWRAVVPMAKVQEAIQEVTGSNPGQISSVGIAEKGESGRAMKLAFGDTVVSGPAFRIAVGSETVRSMLLSDVTVQGDNVVFTGKGFGHGVGMCQWGANYLAKKGQKPEDIIKFYYQDVEIEDLWD